jgi:hypothetical protein
MKGLIATIALALLVVPATFAGEQSLLARVTVYWASGAAGSNHHQCATGRRLQTGDCSVEYATHSLSQQADFSRWHYFGGS